MPSDLRNLSTTANKSGTDYVSNVDYRSRNWTNTVGFPLADRSQLRENSYTDIQRWVSQQPSTLYWSYEWPYSGSGTEGILSTVSEGDPWYLREYYPDYLIFQFLSDKMETDDSLVNEAKTKALLKAGDMKSNFAVSIAEAGKTGDLILSTATRIDRAYRALRKGNFKEVAKQLNISPKKVHNTWLEYRYGWLPLLMDVKGSAELLAQHHLKRASDFTVNGVASDKQNEYATYRTSTPGAFSWTRASAGTKTARVKLRCRIDNDVVAAFQQMGLVNPALVAWELVPYSFVFDWFISVGDWLTAVSALQGLELISAMSSVSFHRTGTHSYRKNSYSAWSTFHSGGSSGLNAIKRDYSRQPMSLSSLTVYPVVNRDVFNMKRVITSLALMRSSSSRTVRI